MDYYFTIVTFLFGSVNDLKNYKNVRGKMISNNYI